MPQSPVSAERVAPVPAEEAQARLQAALETHAKAANFEFQIDRSPDGGWTVWADFKAPLFWIGRFKLFWLKRSVSLECQMNVELTDGWVIKTDAPRSPYAPPSDTPPWYTLWHTHGCEYLRHGSDLTTVLGWFEAQANPPAKR